MRIHPPVVPGGIGPTRGPARGGPKNERSGSDRGNPTAIRRTEEQNYPTFLEDL